MKKHNRNQDLYCIECGEMIEQGEMYADTMNGNICEYCIGEM